MPRPIRTNAGSIRHVGNPSPRCPRQDLGDLEKANAVQRNVGNIGGVTTKRRGQCWGPHTEELHHGVPAIGGNPSDENLRLWALYSGWNSPNPRRK
jgi:hypothetical protein